MRAIDYGLKISAIALRPAFKCTEQICEARARKSKKEFSSWWAMAQFIRYLQFWLRSPGLVYSDIGSWGQELIELEIRLCEVVQREDFLLQQCQQMPDGVEMVDSKQGLQQREQWQQELDSLNQEYWELQRMLYQNALTCPIRSIEASFLTTRTYSKWYLCYSLRNDCTWRGGCCARSCGCCQKPRGSLRSNGHGHCTKACGCCAKARGFELNSEQQKLYRPKIDLKVARPDYYSRAILYAYIFG